MTTNEDTNNLSEIAKCARKDILRMIHAAKSGHPGGSLSCIDILIALYFGGILKHDPKNPDLEDRDYFFLSKGHAAPALYATLARAGYFPTEELDTLRQLGSRLQGHPDSNLVPGVEVGTGSLGQGLSIAAGCAAGLKLDGSLSCVFALLGDGECEEGQVWEAAMFASHYNLNNLIAIIDYNQLQIDGNVNDVAGLGSLQAKFEAFGWRVHEMHGHDFESITATLNAAKAAGGGAGTAAGSGDEDAAGAGKPQVIIAHTIKGRGVSFMEGQAGWHGKAPNAAELEAALTEIEQMR